MSLEVLAIQLTRWTGRMCQSRMWWTRLGRYVVLVVVESTVGARAPPRTLRGSPIRPHVVREIATIA